MHSKELDKIAEALCMAQSVMVNVEKGSKSYSGNYADLGACLDAIRMPFAKNGLSISQQTSFDGKRLCLVTMLLHKSGQFIKSIYPLSQIESKGANSAQQMGMAISYARRYCLSAIAGLAQADNDAASVARSDKYAQSAIRQQKVVDRVGGFNPSAKAEVIGNKSEDVDTEPKPEPKEVDEPF